MNLYLIRHTKLNIPYGICYGQSDVDVYDRFERKAQRVAKKLNKIKFDRIYSSPLQRCSKLAKVIANENEIIYDERLKELNFGDWEMKYWKAIAHETKPFFENYEATSRCPNGESYKDLTDRVTSFLNDLKKLPQSSDICIVSHGGPIRVFWSIYKNIDPMKVFRKRIYHGEIIKIEMQ